MKNNALLMTLFALYLIPVSVRGADIDGKWRCYDKTNVFCRPKAYFTFKADGKTLSGTMPYGGKENDIEHKIFRGTIKGDKIRFSIEFTDNGAYYEYRFNGIIKGDEIKLTCHSRGFPAHLRSDRPEYYTDFSGGGGMSNRELLLRRAEE
jgi:hypothetical protein